MKKFAIIVASGTGSRMRSEIPKQFLLLDGKPVLVHTINKFLKIADIQIFVALSDGGFSFWEETCAHFFEENSERIKLVKGGEARFHSVKNALETISDSEALVAVHDGVRPFVTTEIILESFKTASDFGSAVCSVSSKDSVRVIDGKTNKAIDRNTVKLVQTPQTFKLNILKKSYQTAFSDFFTDDASVVENAGFPIHLTEGSYENIKITTPDDLVLGTQLLEQLGK